MSHGIGGLEVLLDGLGRDNDHLAAVAKEQALALDVLCRELAASDDCPPEAIRTRACQSLPAQGYYDGCLAYYRSWALGKPRTER